MGNPPKKRKTKKSKLDFSKKDLIYAEALFNDLLDKYQDMIPKFFDWLYYNLEVTVRMELNLRKISVENALIVKMERDLALIAIVLGYLGNKRPKTLVLNDIDGLYKEAVYWTSKKLGLNTTFVINDDKKGKKE